MGLVKEMSLKKYLTTRGFYVKKEAPLVVPLELTLNPGVKGGEAYTEA